MNILILNWRDIKNPKSGGAEIVTLQHAKGWIKAGHSVTWFTSSFRNAERTENIDGVNIVRRGNFISVFFLAPFYYLFSKNKFDVVVDQIHGIPFFTPFYVRKPKIALIHEVADEIWDYMTSFPINKIGKILERCVFIPYKSVYFMTVSDSTADELKRIGIRKIKVVLNGINIQNIPNTQKEKVPTFIFVSRVVKMKGIEEVIKSFFQIIKELDDARLWIVGDGDKKYHQFLVKTINTYSISQKVDFLGRVPEQKKLELMKRAHLLLHASVKEGWGLVVIEAASMGTPSVVYDVAGLRDSVLDKKTGIVLKNNTPQEMAKESINLISKPQLYKQFQDSCIEWAKSLSWENSIRDSLSLLNEVVKRTR